MKVYFIIYSSSGTPKTPKNPEKRKREEEESKSKRTKMNSSPEYKVKYSSSKKFYFMGQYFPRNLFLLIVAEREM